MSGTINESNRGLRMAYGLMTLAVVWILNVGETAEQTFETYFNHSLEQNVEMIWCF